MENIKKLNGEYAYKKNQSIYCKDDMLPDKTIVTIPMDSEWKRNCQDSWWFHNFEDLRTEHKTLQIRKMFDLKEKLLSFAGETTCFPWYNSNVDTIINRGQIWYGDKLSHIKGEPSQCHSNSSLIWMSNKDKYRIATGYALTEDGMWREHTWLIENKPRQNKVIETTSKRILYFGFVLTKEECESFYENNQ